LPSGTSDTGISLRLASASGMPMIVIAIASGADQMADGQPDAEQDAPR
jgi:hypothetical protein